MARYGKTHGMTRGKDGKKTPEYQAWRSMLGRCYDKKYKRYERYGGRGIKVCSRWRNSFENFFADLGLRPSPDHSVGRLDNDGNYTPKNVAWQTRQEQAANRMTSRMVTVRGITKSAMEWARDLGLPYNTFKNRLRRGWSAERALTPSRRYTKLDG